jgi:Zn-dependent protease with chaperone function
VAQSDTGRAICPRCASPLVSENRAAPWCERCEWGLDRYEPPVGAGWSGRLAGRVSFRIAYKATTAQFRGLQRTALTRPGFGVVGLALLGISFLLLALILALAVAGVWLMVAYPNVVSFVVGGVAVLVAFALLPPIGRFNRDYVRLRRDEAPTLYSLLDRLAATVGTRAPDVIAVGSAYNASVTAFGLRRRRALYLGLSLWGVLPPQQRIALLGHELGHFVNGDVRNSLLARPAMVTLGRLAQLVMPDRRARSRPPLVAMSEGLLRVVMQPVVVVLILAQLGILALAFRNGQRAEYLADRGSARLAGTNAAVELSNLLLQGEGGPTVISSRARAGLGVAGWRSAIEELRQEQTAGRIQRLRQLTVRSDSSLLATHPPQGLRSRLLEAGPWLDPAFVLTDAESDKIDTELARYYDRFRRDIAHNYL